MLFIYQIKNLVNNKLYFGQTNDPYMRWMGHQSVARRGKQHPLYDSMRKHGVSNFSFTVLSQHETQEETNIKERELIASNNTCDRLCGYNLEPGGNRTERTEETKQKISESRNKLFQERLEQTGSKITEEYRQKLSDSHKGLPSPNKGKKTGKPAWNRGVPQSAATKQKLSERMKGRKPWNAKT